MQICEWCLSTSHTVINAVFFSFFNFLSLYSMKNHEKSKKHRELVGLLRQQLEEEDNSFGLNLDPKEGIEQEEDEEEEENRPRQKCVAFSFHLVVPVV